MQLLPQRMLRMGGERAADGQWMDADALGRAVDGPWADSDFWIGHEQAALFFPIFPIFPI